MSVRIAILAALLVPAAPAFAQSVADTHAEMWLPSGKVPQRVLRPIARNDCRTAYSHHQAGKTVPLPAAAREDRHCVVETAMRDRQPNP